MIMMFSGESPALIRNTGPTGKIWRRVKPEYGRYEAHMHTSISPRRFFLTRELAGQHKFLQAAHAQIKKEFDISWTDVDSLDLLRPLYSGIAARLTMLLCSNIEPRLSIPDADDDLAAYWRTCAHAVIEDKLVENRKRACTVENCAARMDMCIMVDSSGSIDAVDFQRSRLFVDDLLFSYDGEQVRTNVLLFSSTVLFVSNFNSTTDDQRAAVMRAPHLQGGTATADALYYCYYALQNMPTISSATPKVNLLLTDGESNEWTHESLNSVLLRTAAANIVSFAIGVGSWLNTEELKSIAGNHSERVFNVRTASDLQSRLGQIRRATCRTPQTPEFEQPYEEALGKDECRPIKIDIPEELTEIALDVKCTEGSVNIPYAWGYENPSRAAHDGICRAPGCIIPRPQERSRRSTATLPSQPSDTAKSYLYLSVIGEESFNKFIITAKVIRSPPEPVPSVETVGEMVGSDVDTSDMVDAAMIHLVREYNRIEYIW
ncbi:uncharacterized protein LOC129585606 isoform X2 [Paramacrobiotus metropolitanus]|uniref:uncharacterized protein LOC129585606 isoform X2 n=1 Tax=Paramacrobiotus metropolitanus TaxID=2943436 RepID=UPI002445C9FC|nr:uncharacterized protein LOC129585606 isoform X2 [Paramacrobiotus metropolitanus]